jgi:hypothetical protein
MPGCRVTAAPGTPNECLIYLFNPICTKTESDAAGTKVACCIAEFPVLGKMSV